MFGGGPGSGFGPGFPGGPRIPGGRADPLGDLYLFQSSDGRVHSNPQDAIAGSLSNEDEWGTGAGCNQSPEQVRPHRR